MAQSKLSARYMYRPEEDNGLTPEELTAIIRELDGFKGAAPWRNNSTSDIGRQI